jgi:hypothetical protein
MKWKHPVLQYILESKKNEIKTTTNNPNLSFEIIKNNLHVKNNTMYNMVTYNKKKNNTLKELFLNYYKNFIYLKPSTKNSKVVTKEANKIILFNLYLNI